jgi:RHS repeat-associated protein
MAATAEERIPVLKSREDIFSLAVPFVACSENRIGTNALEGKKPHQGIFSKNRTIAVGATWVKWSGTHQDSGRSWPETVLGIAIDANGNTLSDPSGKSYSWDFENRLTQAIVPGTGTTNFRYDPFGRRIRKSGPLGTTNYLYDGLAADADIIEEINNSGTVVTDYTQGPAVDEPLADIMSGTTSYYQADNLGSITSLSSPAASLVDTYVYDSFGKLTASTGTLVNEFQYTARELDAETGGYYYRARYYDQSIGRFASEDPSRFTAGLNFYSYTKNSPVNATDPSGLRTQLCCRPGINKYKRLLGEHHCFVVITNPNVNGGSPTSYSYLSGPRQNADIDSYNNGSAVCTDVSCPCSGELAMNNNYTNAGLSAGQNGSFFGPNSNTWAANLLQWGGCKVPAKPPANAYGYGYGR